jgi:peptide/nickel transport system substrate-binding protein
VKIDIRWQLLLASVCLLFVLTLLGLQIQTVGLCTVAVPTRGGKLVEGMIGKPHAINPLLSMGNPVDEELSSLIFDGLVKIGEDGQFEPAIAESWEVTDDGRTLRFELKDNVFWHDGQPVTSADVEFTYGLLQDESFPASPVLKSMWQSVAISRTNDSSVEFLLPQPYSPFLEATSIGLLPAHILGDIRASELPEHPFNLAPVGSGPFELDTGELWTKTGKLTLAPNPDFWQKSTLIDAIEFRFFPDSQSLAKAFGDGDVQAVTSVPTEDILQFAAAEGMRLFTYGISRYTQIIFNLRDGGNPALGPLDVRTALALALDRPRLIDQALSGQGLPLEGPYIPQSWVYNANQGVREYDPNNAKALLEAAGWNVPEGSKFRQQDGRNLSVRLLIADNQVNQELAKVIAEQWANIGVEVLTTFTDPLDLSTELSTGNFDVAIVDIDVPIDPDLYDFWSQESIVDGQNFSGWNNRRASEALESARQLWNADERAPYYGAFLSLFDNDLPALTLYQHVRSYGLSESVNEADIGRIDSSRERFQTFPDWFLQYRDVAIECDRQAT